MTINSLPVLHDHAEKKSAGFATRLGTMSHLLIRMPAFFRLNIHFLRGFVDPVISSIDFYSLFLRPRLALPVQVRLVSLPLVLSSSIPARRCKHSVDSQFPL